MTSRRVLDELQQQLAQSRAKRRECADELKASAQRVLAQTPVEGSKQLIAGVEADEVDECEPDAQVRLDQRKEQVRESRQRRSDASKALKRTSIRACKTMRLDGPLRT